MGDPAVRKSSTFDVPQIPRPRSEDSLSRSSVYVMCKAEPGTNGAAWTFHGTLDRGTQWCLCRHPTPKGATRALPHVLNSTQPSTQLIELNTTQLNTTWHGARRGDDVERAAGATKRAPLARQDCSNTGKKPANKYKKQQTT